MGFYFPFKACWKKGTNVFWKLELLPCWFWSQQKIEQVSGCFFLTGISDKFNFERRYSWYTVGKNSNNKSSIMNVNLRVTIYRPSFEKKTGPISAGNWVEHSEFFLSIYSSRVGNEIKKVTSLSISLVRMLQSKIQSTQNGTSDSWATHWPEALRCANLFHIPNVIRRTEQTKQRVGFL